MERLIVGVGIPASGKSTILKKFAEKYGYTYICLDDIRQATTGDASNLLNDAQVLKQAHQIMSNTLGNGKTIVYDATNTKRERRIELIRTAREYGAKRIQGVFVDIPLATAKRRNAQRERAVPERVLKDMHNRLLLNPPQISEGFDCIFILNEHGRIKKVTRRGS